MVKTRINGKNSKKSNWPFDNKARLSQKAS